MRVRSAGERFRALLPRAAAGAVLDQQGRSVGRLLVGRGERYRAANRTAAMRVLSALSARPICPWLAEGSDTGPRIARQQCVSYLPVLICPCVSYLPVLSARGAIPGRESHGSNACPICLCVSYLPVLSAHACPICPSYLPGERYRAANRTAAMRVLSAPHGSNACPICLSALSYLPVLSALSACALSA
jgi:hypothetical protein